MSTATEIQAFMQAIIDAPDDDGPRLVYADWLQDRGDLPVVKRFGVDFHSDGGALTLGSGDLGVRPDGWTVLGEVREDYYEWVNDFVAVHPRLGLVWGNFEGEVRASSEEAFQGFWADHKPSAWDYQDI